MTQLGTTGVLIACAIAARLFFILRRLVMEWRVTRLVRGSKTLYYAKEHDRALAVAEQARALSLALMGKHSDAHMDASIHLASVHSGMRKHELALLVLAECDDLARAHVHTPLTRVPVLHASAEVLEDSGQLQGATDALEEARSVRRAALGERSLLYACSCHNLAGMLVRRAHDAAQRAVGGGRVRHPAAVHLGRAAALTIEAVDVATAAGEKQDGGEFIDTILNLVLHGGPSVVGFGSKLDALPEAAPHIAKLRQCAESVRAARS